jgi:hypothetical protein
MGRRAQWEGEAPAEPLPRQRRLAWAAQNGPKYAMNSLWSRDHFCSSPPNDSPQTDNSCHKSSWRVFWGRGQGEGAKRVPGIPPHPPLSPIVLPVTPS